MTKRIFLTSSVNRVAADIAKKIRGAKNKKILYIYTAYEQKMGEQWQEDDKKALSKAGFKIIEYTITGKTRKNIAQDIKSVDIIYVAGGNTFYLLEKIQETKCANIIRDYVNRGKIYIGTSAGSIIAGPDIYPAYELDNISEASKLKGYKGLSLVDFVVMPHWGSDHFRSRYLDKRMENNYNTKNKLILLNDYQYIQIETEWYKIVEVKHSIN